MLIMHTSTKDEAGQDLEAIVHQVGLTNGEVKFSTAKVPPHQLAMMYNMADCTINIADAEGFGLSSLESLSCGTPVINTMTGGLQEQVTDGENWFGIGIAFIKIHEMSDEKLAELGSAGRDHTLKNYNFEKFNKQWIDLMTETYEKRGSWENRKMYNRWELIKMGDK